jgi:hypothetical protein
MVSTWFSVPCPRSISATTIVPSGDQLGLRPFWLSDLSPDAGFDGSQVFSFQPPSAAETP